MENAEIFFYLHCAFGLNCTPYMGSQFCGLNVLISHGAVAIL
jgi:hypothetical protein